MSNRSNRTYSLWLVPGAETTARRQLQSTITELAERYEDAPVFEPHVTVIGGIDGEQTALEETTRTLAARTATLELAFEGVRWSTTRHQCVFLPVEPTLDLMDLRRSAREAIDRSTAAYHPHLSLVYGGMDLTERRDIAQSIDTAALPGHITCQALALVDTTGSESEWETLVSVPLSGP
ncbi:2'-5' RNA ligase family protein [Halorubrum ezzemoulense]|uniref:2'-5' RNA ligase family protein n=1 Tax=Halorubrum ezzemoulense TaxID=337243 RepID=UPI00232D0527|nr:2'-5' RNA ligase family protein [Halorubrum ezzemoulense]MDB9235510.1 2'-5' RNA ligase family protein [Halorubrum ezzemoulense]